MRRMFVIALVAALPATAAAQVVVHMDHKVKTTQSYGMCVDNGVDAIHSWWCNIISFSADPLVTIAPGSGDPGVTSNEAAIAVVPSCWMDCSSGQCCADFSFHFPSLRDLGTFTIDCDGFGANPSYCAGTCTPTCDVAAVYQLATVLRYIVNVWNDAPSASISHGPTPAWNNTVTLHANSSDPDGGSVTHTWSITSKPAGSSKSLSSASSADPTITFNNDDDIGTWNFQLHVDDNEKERKTFTHSFTVPNVPPSVTINGDADIDAMDPIELQVTPTTDVDGGNFALTWDIISSPPGASIGATNGYSTAVGISIPTTGDDVGIWEFRVTAEDNEGAEDQDTITVEVHNLPPEIDFYGETDLNIGDVVQVETLFIDDLDGGELFFDWAIVQAPVAGTSGIQSGYSLDPSVYMSTTFDDAGTWIFELTVTDDEGDSVTETISVLVDAPPEAEISGPGTIDLINFPLVFEGGQSWDPDSDCPLDPSNHCHITDGRPVSEISPGISTHTWYVTDIPPEHSSDYWVGRVDEIFGVNGTGTQLTFGVLDIKPGQWTFELEIYDGDSGNNFDNEDEEILIHDPNIPPVLSVTPPFRYETLAGAVILPVTLTAYAIDLDNLLLGDPFEAGVGISSYDWTPFPPFACSGTPGPFSGATLDTLEIYPAATLIDPPCLGVWNITVEVTDDDTPDFKNTAATQVIIGNCPSFLCIDWPTTFSPAFVELASDTDVLILYHMDATVYDDPIFLNGLYAQLDIFHESDLVTPVFTAYDPNLLVSNKGSLLAFHWNGYWDNGFTALPGFYTLRMNLLDGVFGPTAVLAEEQDAIWIEVAEVTIDPSATRFVDYDELDIGADWVEVPYDIAGSVVLADVVAEVRDASSSVIAQISLGPAPAGVFQWDGQVAGSTVLPGVYSIVIDARSATGSFGKSTPHEVVVYQVRLEPVGPSLGGIPPEVLVLANLDDDDADNVADASDPGPITGENDLISFDVVVEPFGALLTAQLRFDGGAANAAMFETADKSISISDPQNYDISFETPPAVIYVEGVQPGDATLALELADDLGVPLATRTILLHVVNVDADVDTDMNGTIQLADDVLETNDKALVVNINNDDNDADGADHLDNATDGAADEAQLSQLVLRRIQFVPAGGRVEITVSDKTKLRIFDDTKAGVIGPSMADGGPDADTFIIPTAKITAGDLNYLIECFNHGNVTITLKLIDSANVVIAQDQLKVALNVDRTPAGGAVRFRVYGLDAAPAVTLRGMRGNLSTAQAKVNWAPTIRMFSSTNVWLGVQDMGTPDGNFWMQTGLAIDRNVGGAATAGVYFEVSTGTIGPYYMNMRPGGVWPATAQYSAALENLATGEIVARIDGVMWDHYVHAEWKTRRAETYHAGSELFHSLDQNPGTAAQHCKMWSLQIDDAGAWSATTLAAGDFVINDVDRNGVDFSPAASPEWAYTSTAGDVLHMWDQVVEY